MELHIVIDGDKDLVEQVYQQIRVAIQTGRLTVGEQVPPSRLLAQQLQVSRKTISEAYTRLTIDRFLTGEVGVGTFVNAATRSQPRRFAAKDLAASATLKNWLSRSVPLHHLEPEMRSAFDFVGGGASKSHFPIAEWRQCMLHGLRKSHADSGFYSEPEGLPTLREAIARHTAFSRGVQCVPMDVLVTNGAQQAIDLIARVLLDPGSTVAIEDPGYPPARLIFSSQGANVVCIPVDAEGMVVELIPDGTRLIYVTPAHQFPLGMPMSAARRKALLKRAGELGAIIIEDDYDSEFRYEGRPTDSLQSMDTDGLVAFVGTFSKVMLPELRVGYLIAPPSIRKAVTIAKHLCDWHTPTMMQWALAKFIDDGYLQKHIRRCHAMYASRREKLLSRLAGDLAPWLRAIPATAGFHLTALTTREIDIPLLLKLARRADVGLYATDVFYHLETPVQSLFFGYGAIETLDIEPALDRVKTILTEIA
ncbi:GntR family transcriptional regulator / MocR family aminotransferase [Collimonas sp. OK307]|uniref:MocR-like pyridoxine biosynthesis transcription factor PdxR n=1 Tax=Collimonas sp. OK307 TaxID=1801620 RepID=UPI0008E43958|nr:PLP-dependent aminotransferase family protein [Collimonas sp. OK307]SFI32595.1 GntR family transcriptional regulator / MocR family aminotransferase [Collimonas sp. OK307]